MPSGAHRVLLLFSALASGEPGLSSPARCRLEEGSCPLHDMELDSSTLVLPGGQSRCIFSNVASEYAFQVIPGDTNKLLIFFQGGGACFNDASTQGAAPCLSHVVVQPLVGIFDRTNAANPYRKYTVVHINYCSGDLHIGNVVRWYLDGAGQRVEQRGFLNVLSAVKWTRRNIPGRLASLIIAGSSTGALGAQLWAATLLRSFSHQSAAVISDSALGIFPEHSQGPLLAGFGLCKSGLLDDSAGLQRLCTSQQLTMQDIFHQLAADYPHVALSVITSQQDAMQIKIYNAVCMANMMTERDSAAEWESKLMATLESYNKHPSFVLYLMSGKSDYFLPVKELFTTDLRGKHGLPSYGLKLVQWLESFPVFAGQSISSECSACAPALGSKTFTAPTARLQQESLVAVKPRDLPKESKDDVELLPSIHVEPPSLDYPWWSYLYYASLLVTAALLSLGAAQEWCHRLAGLEFVRLFRAGQASKMTPITNPARRGLQTELLQPTSLADSRAAGSQVKERLAALAQEGGGWDNKPVLDAAPHAAKVSKYITPSQMVVVSTKVGDLVTCIRASTIDSEALMKEVTEEEMTEFFIYAREVNSAMAEFRTRNTGHVCRLISANDLTGVSKFPDQSFQNALTGSAKRAVTLYPGYSGPTVLLNLPWLARMLVSILTPLFPGAVREKIKFARGPMAYMKDLEDVIKEPTRGMFVDDLQAVLNS
ncbi:unnamed protein product [Symbiodinium sp. CCMP2456]|nr:unnamed protein product [Symbiodinium sp. CCMP2456]